MLWLLAALLVVTTIRLWRLPEAGFPDYDSVRNWQVAQEMARGDFSRLFALGSPAFLLFYAGVAVFTQNYLVFQVINALLGVAGVGCFCAWVAKRAKLTGPETAGLALLGGTSLLLTFSGRDLNPNAISLVLFAGLLRSHFSRLHKPSATAVLRVVGWLAVAMCFNFKFLFTIPILAVLELWQADGLWRQRTVWGRALLIMAAPYVIFGVFSVVVGLPWYRWVGFYIRQVIVAGPNHSGHQSTVHIDLLYYFRYLAEYESPLLLAGLVVSGWMVWYTWQRKEIQWGRALPFLPYLLVWAGCLLAGMSIVVKAPREIIFAYLPLAALAVLSGRSLLPAWVLLSTLVAAVGLNVFRIQRELYSALPTPYPQVAAWLQAHGATKIASTVGMGVAPYLSSTQTLKVVNNEQQLASLRRLGYQYVLLDAYWRVAGVYRFDSLRRQTPVATWPAPQFQRPLLFLEHSEYTGKNFAETLAAYRASVADTLPLRLYRLQ